MSKEIKPNQIIEVLEHLNKYWKPDTNLFYLLKSYKRTQEKIEEKGE